MRRKRVGSSARGQRDAEDATRRLLTAREVERIAEVYYTCGGLTAENVADVFDRLSMRPPPEEVIGAEFANVRRKDRAAFLDKQALERLVAASKQHFASLKARMASLEASDVFLALGGGAPVSDAALSSILKERFSLNLNGCNLFPGASPGAGRSKTDFEKALVPAMTGEQLELFRKCGAEEDVTGVLVASAAAVKKQLPPSSNAPAVVQLLQRIDADKAGCVEAADFLELLRLSSAAPPPVAMGNEKVNKLASMVLKRPVTPRRAERQSIRPDGKHAWSNLLKTTLDSTTGASAWQAAASSSLGDSGVLAADTPSADAAQRPSGRLLQQHAQAICIPVPPDPRDGHAAPRPPACAEPRGKPRNPSRKRRAAAPKGRGCRAGKPSPPARPLWQPCSRVGNAWSACAAAEAEAECTVHRQAGPAPAAAVFAQLHEHGRVFRPSAELWKLKHSNIVPPQATHQTRPATPHDHTPSATPPSPPFSQATARASPANNAGAAASCGGERSGAQREDTLVGSDGGGSGGGFGVGGGWGDGVGGGFGAASDNGVGGTGVDSGGVGGDGGGFGLGVGSGGGFRGGNGVGDGVGGEGFGDVGSRGFGVGGGGDGRNAWAASGELNGGTAAGGFDTRSSDPPPGGNPAHLSETPHGGGFDNAALDMHKLPPPARLSPKRPRRDAPKAATRRRPHGGRGVGAAAAASAGDRMELRLCYGAYGVDCPRTLRLLHPSWRGDSQLLGGGGDAAAEGKLRRPQSALASFLEHRAGAAHPPRPWTATPGATPAEAAHTTRPTAAATFPAVPHSSRPAPTAATPRPWTASPGAPPTGVAQTTRTTEAAASPAAFPHSSRPAPTAATPRPWTASPDAAPSPLHRETDGRQPNPGAATQLQRAAAAVVVRCARGHSGRLFLAVTASEWGGQTAAGAPRSGVGGFRQSFPAAETGELEVVLCTAAVSVAARRSRAAATIGRAWRRCAVKGRRGELKAVREAENRADSAAVAIQLAWRSCTARAAAARLRHPAGARQGPPVSDAAGTSATSNPQDAGRVTGNPQDAGSAKGNPQDAGSAKNNPQNAGSAADNSQDAGSATGNPQDAGSATGNPQNAGSVTGNPQDAGSATGNPQDAGSVTGNPQDAGSATGNPQDAGGASDAPIRQRVPAGLGATSTSIPEQCNVAGKPGGAGCGLPEKQPKTKTKDARPGPASADPLADFVAQCVAAACRRLQSLRRDVRRRVADLAPNRPAARALEASLGSFAGAAVARPPGADADPRAAGLQESSGALVARCVAAAGRRLLSLRQGVRERVAGLRPNGSAFGAPTSISPQDAEKVRKPNESSCGISSQIALQNAEKVRESNRNSSGVLQNITLENAENPQELNGTSSGIVTNIALRNAEEVHEAVLKRISEVLVARCISAAGRRLHALRSDVRVRIADLCPDHRPATQALAPDGPHGSSCTMATIAQADDLQNANEVQEAALKKTRDALVTQCVSAARRKLLSLRGDMLERIADLRSNCHASALNGPGGSSVGALAIPEVEDLRNAMEVREAVVEKISVDLTTQCISAATRKLHILRSGMIERIADLRSKSNQPS
ncbi:hypothetical protein DIPPA_12259 [Diplonema papillatum]|nr:hypothetical protein DIPPA_12259 [Diplonema papillatum]